MEPRAHEPAADMLQLLARLHQQIAPLPRESDGDAPAGVARPDVQAGVARAAVDGEEVEVSVEACEDRVLCAVFGEVGGGGGEEVGAGEGIRLS